MTPISNLPYEIFDIVTTPQSHRYSVEGDDDIPGGQRNTTLISICGSLKARGLSVEDIWEKLAEINRKRCNPPLDDEQLARIANQARGWDDPAFIAAHAPDGMPKLRRNKQGIADGAMSNLSTILHYDPRVNKLFKWNDLADACFIVGNPPWYGESVNRCLFDNDYNDFKNWLTDRIHGSGHAIADPAGVHIHEAISVVANKNKYHPIIEWLSGLTWDGVSRVENFCHEVFGVENTAYHKIAGKILLYGSTARVIYPGCKFDYMPIISGKQGILKSTLIRELFGPWIGALSPKNLEVGNQIRGKWVAEDAELVCMKRFGDSFFKAWISDESDSYRIPYERHYRNVKKCYIIIGTTNKDEFLNDYTGGRRFLPIYCGDRMINLAYAIRWREQLFAEAKVMVTNTGERNIGKLWTDFDKELAKDIESAQEKARVKTTIEEVIIAFLSRFEVSKERITTIDVVIGCIRANIVQGIPLYRATDFRDDVVFAVMRSEGWVRSKGYWKLRRRVNESASVVAIRPERDGAERNPFLEEEDGRA